MANAGDGTSRTIYMENEEPDRVLDWLFAADGSAPFESQTDTLFLTALYPARIV